jgi:CheY-like chemotaxis protein
MYSRLQKISSNEANMRVLNEATHDESEEHASHPIEMVCECGDASCVETISICANDYEHVRGAGKRFAVVPGHDIASAERVVDRFDTYWIVEKFGEARPIAEGRDPRHNDKPCRVLVVDDVVEVRILLKMLMQLEPMCAVVGEAGNGRDAIICAERTQPEVIILDLEMPVMTGLEALPELRRVAPTSKIILFSGSDSIDERQMARLGVFEIVPKGGDPARLIDVIRRISVSGAERSDHFDAG